MKLARNTITPTVFKMARVFPSVLRRLFVTIECLHIRETYMHIIHLDIVFCMALEQCRIHLLGIPIFFVLLKLAKATHIPSMLTLGKYLKNAIGIPNKDPQGSACRDASAQNYLGAFYQNGWGISGIVSDPVKAVSWYRLAAAETHTPCPMAMCNLAHCLLNGIGAKRDPLTAIKLSRTAAEKHGLFRAVNLQHCWRQEYLTLYLLIHRRPSNGISPPRLNISLRNTD